MRTVRLTNSGLVLFLYDAAATAELRATNAPILSGFDGAPESAAGLEGRLVAVELPQDGPIALPVQVGSALSREDKKACAWHRAVKSALSVPSGRLRLDSYDSLPLGCDAPASDGVELEVEPGDYLVRVLYVNVDETFCTDRELPGFPLALELTFARPPKRVKALILCPAAFDEEEAAFQRERLNDPVDRVRAAAASAIGSFRFRHLAPSLMACLDDPSSLVRGRAMAALGDLRAREAEPRLLAMLDAEDAFERTQAARAAMGLETRAALPRLRELQADDPSSGVRGQARAAIRHIER